MKKGFTLIELLAVIVILGVILLIAVTAVSNVINNAKKNSYDIQTKLIVDAARKYVTSMVEGVATNSQKVITLKDLQDNNYIEQNIKDPRTGSVLSNKTWIIAKNTNGVMEYMYGYEADGLVIHYDAKNNGGLGTYNDNSSTNKGTWYDLSGNNYNAVLNNFSYDSNSGWQSDSLKLDSTNDNVRMDVPGGQEITLDSGATLSITFKCNQLAAENYTYFPYGYGSNGYIHFGWGALNNIFIFYGGGQNSVMGQSNFTMTAGVSYNTVFVQEKDYTKKIYINGILVATDTVSNYTPSRFKFAFLEYNQGSLNSNYYSIKVYNRGLTSTEVIHNYDVDKMIYGL